jgi:hypothetical protein
MTIDLDLNDATGKQRSFDLIPHGTIVTLQIKVRSGNAGEGGWLRRSKDGNSEALDLELTVVGGPHDKRKIWDLVTVAGTTSGHAQAIEISRARLCAIIECARGIRPNDASEAARQARHLNSYGDFDGLRFIAKIGIEKGAVKPNGGGTFPDKNRLLEVITPDRKEWQKVDQPPPQPTAAPGALVTPPPSTSGGEVVQRPGWSK